MFVVGKSANGLTSWKDGKGRSLKDIENGETVWTEISMNKTEVIEKAAHEILNEKMESAKELIQNEYPFRHLTPNEREYTDK